MIKQSYNVIGVMSGTSLDGADLASILFTCSGGEWSFIINSAETVPYGPAWVSRLKKAVDFTDDELHLLNRDYTALLSGIINNFIEKHSITGVDAVCSHGHTVLHRPKEGITLQIGNLPEIAALTGKKVVCDFRVADVEMGGQGAPLVPIGDRLLFARYDYCLNLGGFSNISFEENGKRIAFDICPVNTVLNHYAAKLGYEYDENGRMANAGSCVKPMLDELNLLDYYKQPYPKSLGFEYVKQIVIPVIEKYNASPTDVLHTFTIHAAAMIAGAVAKKGAVSLLITGGGAYNAFLVRHIKDLSADTKIFIPDDKTIQYKEAVIFGLLGVLRLRGEINVLCSVTGAAKDHCSGKIYEP